MKNIFALLFFFNYLFSTVHFASPGTYTCLQDNGVSLEFTTNKTSTLSAPRCGISYNTHIYNNFRTLLNCGISSMVNQQNTNCSNIIDFFDKKITGCRTNECGHIPYPSSESTSCTSICKSNYTNAKAQALANSAHFNTNFEEKETYMTVKDGEIGAVSYDLSDKTHNFIPGASLDVNETVVCPSHQRLIITNRMTVGTSGDIQFNSYECINKNETIDYNGNPLEINYDNDGNIIDSTLSKEKYNYKIVCYENGTCEGIITDKDGKVLGKYDVDKNNPDEFYNKVPTEFTGPTNPTEPTDPTNPTNPTEPTDPTNPTEPTEPTDPTNPTNPTGGSNNTGIDGLDDNFINLPSGTGTSLADIFGGLKNSIDGNTEALNNFGAGGSNSENNPIQNIDDTLTQEATQSSFDTSSFEEFGNNISQSFTELGETFENLKEMFENGFEVDFSKYKNYNDCTLSGNFFGQTITFDVCEPFLPFREFISFIITFLLIYRSVLIFLWGIRK
jgi:hypothetical protein